MRDLGEYRAIKIMRRHSVLHRLHDPDPERRPWPSIDEGHGRQTRL